MVAYRSFGSQRAPVAMREAYLRPRPDDPVAAAKARTRSGWAVAGQPFPPTGVRPRVRDPARREVPPGIGRGPAGRVRRHRGVRDAVGRRGPAGEPARRRGSGARRTGRGRAGDARPRRSRRRGRTVRPHQSRCHAGPCAGPPAAHPCRSSSHSRTVPTTGCSRGSSTCGRRGRGCWRSPPPGAAGRRGDLVRQGRRDRPARRGPRVVGRPRARGTPARSPPTQGPTRSPPCAGGSVDSGPRPSARPTPCCRTTSSHRSGVVVRRSPGVPPVGRPEGRSRLRCTRWARGVRRAVRSGRPRRACGRRGRAGCGCGCCARRCPGRRCWRWPGPR